MELPQLDDPLDFSSRSLQSLDSALRCQICHELYTAPVLLTTCSHTFDSLCLRNHLRESKKCPQCSIEANEDRIRRNLVVEQVVYNWKQARAHLVSLEAPPLPIPSTSRSPIPPLTTTRSKRKLEDVQQPEDDSSDIEVIEDRGMTLRKRRPQRFPTSQSTLTTTTTNGNASRPKGKGKGKAKEVDPKDPSILVNCPLCTKLVKNGSISAHIDSNCKKFIVTSSPPRSSTTTPTTNAFGRLMGMTQSNPANELTEGGGGGGGSGSRDKNQEALQDTTKYLALPNYAHKKLKDMEALLKASGLPTTVPTSHSQTVDQKISYLKKRHSQYLTFWNSNADIDPKFNNNNETSTTTRTTTTKTDDDTRHPSMKQEGGGGGGYHKSVAELKQELRKWEKVLLTQEKLEKQQKTPSSSTLLGATAKGRTSSIRVEGSGYAKSHENDFKSLIELARASHEKDKLKRTRQTATEPRIEKGEDEEKLRDRVDGVDPSSPEVEEEVEGHDDASVVEQAEGQRTVDLSQEEQLAKETNDGKVEARGKEEEEEMRMQIDDADGDTQSKMNVARSPHPVTAASTRIKKDEEEAQDSKPSRRTVRIVTPPPLVGSSGSSTPSPSMVARDEAARREVWDVDEETKGRRGERSSSILEYDEKFFPPTSQRVREVDWEMIRKAREEEELEEAQEEDEEENEA